MNDTVSIDLKEIVEKVESGEITDFAYSYVDIAGKARCGYHLSTRDNHFTLSGGISLLQKLITNICERS